MISVIIIWIVFDLITRGAVSGVLLYGSGSDPLGTYGALSLGLLLGFFAEVTILEHYSRTPTPGWIPVTSRLALVYLVCAIALGAPLVLILRSPVLNAVNAGLVILASITWVLVGTIILRAAFLQFIMDGRLWRTEGVLKRSVVTSLLATVVSVAGCGLGIALFAVVVSLARA